MTRDAWIGVVFLAFAIVYWIAADGIRISPLDGPVTAAGLPKSLAYALGMLAVLLILRSLALKRTKGGEPVRAADAAPPDDAERPALYRHLRALGMLAFGIGYLLVVPYVGYPLAIVCLMLGVAVYIGARFGAKTAAIAGLGGLFFYLLFVQILDIPLPEGIWPTLFGTLQG
jgi:hypothetical protein